MTSLTTEEDRPFPFFDFPRELRDMVYDNLKDRNNYVLKNDTVDEPVDNEYEPQEDRVSGCSLL